MTRSTLFIIDMAACIRMSKSARALFDGLARHRPYVCIVNANRISCLETWLCMHGIHNSLIYDELLVKDITKLADITKQQGIVLVDIRYVNLIGIRSLYVFTPIGDYYPMIFNVDIPYKPFTNKATFYSYSAALASMSNEKIVVLTDDDQQAVYLEKTLGIGPIPYICPRRQFQIKPFMKFLWSDHRIAVLKIHRVGTVYWWMRMVGEPYLLGNVAMVSHIRHIALADINDLRNVIYVETDG